jgi:hypothetical protein
MADEPGNNPAPDRQAGGVSLQEAALRLDVSERTVRRLIQEGSVQAYKQKAARGFVWRVVLDHRPGDQPGIEARQDGTQTGTSPAQAEQATSAAPELMKALEIIETIQREHEEARRELEAKAEKIAELTGTAAHWQARALIAEDRVRLLTAPKESAPEPEPATVDQARPRPWWRRLFGGV